jgi:UDP-sugar pyrophosphorylase
MLMVSKLESRFWKFEDLLFCMHPIKICLCVMQAGVKIEAPKVEIFNGQEVEVWPRIVWNPEWGLTFADVKRKLSGISSVSQGSTLVIHGKHILLDNLNLDGALIVRAVDSAEVTSIISI